MLGARARRSWAILSGHAQITVGRRVEDASSHLLRHRRKATAAHQSCGVVIAAAEAAVGLGLAIAYHRSKKTTDLDAMTRMKG